MSDVFFTSDLHLGHAKVAEIRGFASPAAHDQAVLDHLADYVGRDDTLIVLGDLALKGAATARALALLTQLPCAKHLVWGNHDEGHPQHRNAPARHARYLGVFDTVASAARRRVDGAEVLLSHYPYDGDHDGRPDRDVQWRLRDCGVPLLHGHVHSKKRTTLSEAGTLQVHVGLDAWSLEPVALSTVSLLLRDHAEAAL